MGTMAGGRYTAAMLAELVGVPPGRIRAWLRRGWLVPAEEAHRVVWFDFTELQVARQLARLTAARIAPRWLDTKLAWLAQHFPHVQRPLAELQLVLDGRALLVRRGEGLIEAGGQLRIDFDAAADEGELPVVPVGRWLNVSGAQAVPPAEPTQLAAWAAELEERGALAEAVEMYRAALAAGGPHAEWCFQLAELLYRMGHREAALERYYVALELDEEFVEARVNLGCVLLEQHQSELALAAFQGALQTYEEYPDAHYHLARTLDQLGRGPEAVRHWQRFLELAPDSPWSEEARLRLDAFGQHASSDLPHVERAGLP
jgi:tetratricopeptide (TPR) repeat protein